MLLTKDQQKLFDDPSVTKSMIMKFYRRDPTFLYPSATLYPTQTLFPGTQPGTILVKTVTDGILLNSVKVTESISNNNTLQFGTVTANKMTADIDVDIDVSGLFVEVTETAQGVTLPLFYGVIDVAKRKTVTNRNIKTITSYDILYSYLNIDITDWYNSLTFPMSILDLRTAMASNFGLTYTSATLVNDSLIIGRIEARSLTARKLLQFICEINGVFANVNRYKQLEFISLTAFNLIYPSGDLYPSSGLYPGIQSENANIYTIDKYKPSDYGEYRTRGITRVEIHIGNEISASYGDGDNIYKIKDNLIAESMSNAVILQALQNFLILVGQITYVPITISLEAKPYLEVGDIVQFPIGTESVSSFILQRTITGITEDKYEAKGEEYHDKSYAVGE